MSTQVELLNNEGVKHFLKGSFDKAKNKYQEALSISPDYATTLNNMGMLLLQEKEYEKARKLFKRAIKKEENATYVLNLGHTFANQNLLKEAEDNYIRSIELNPDSLMSWKSLASLYQYQKKYIDSTRIWSNVINKYSTDPLYKIELAKDLIELREYQQALDILSEASKQENYQDISWYYIALIHFHHKNFGLSEIAIKNSLAVNPSSSKVRSLLASIYLGASKLEEALGQWNLILKENPKNHKIRTDKAVTLLAYGKRNDALKELDLVLADSRSDYKALFYKALILIESGVKTPEVKNYLKIIINKNNAFTEKAKKLLKSINN
ncbi:tetratricopeptide repeat protein [Aquimarina sp. MMG016]|uniref:tetratricopeptide repeat protein n=1 Tax=Aquimarina sp. MMG016 TaxID=2822690 RepID=UPI001B3A3C13|nr:tetratricopeptide repeat protein [Aquimarina sp. MMG016]MBQ4818573.1 tetratricopeptide repeat protein [Aquimarina sp. MMG016]